MVFTLFDTYLYGMDLWLFIMKYAINAWEKELASSTLLGMHVILFIMLQSFPEVFLYYRPNCLENIFYLLPSQIEWTV